MIIFFVKLIFSNVSFSFFSNLSAVCNLSSSIFICSASFFNCSFCSTFSFNFSNEGFNSEISFSILIFFLIFKSFSAFTSFCQISAILKLYFALNSSIFLTSSGHSSKSFLILYEESILLSEIKS